MGIRDNELGEKIQLHYLFEQHCYSLSNMTTEEERARGSDAGDRSATTITVLQSQ